ncbi:hypothetical protein GDO81_019139 [Engystomops pustulosus]|uniref:Uncharacterized protein n=1 Tax=Engystomops pustulosus TaxID=76066 RepID=A0AAV6ZTF7_ENGPU|nr:hypothetical protein GDO81_019139 [Engystomops pustulosus]
MRGLLLRRQMAAHNKQASQGSSLFNHRFTLKHHFGEEEGEGSTRSSCGNLLRMKMFAICPDIVTFVLHKNCSIHNIGAGRVYSKMSP